MPHPAPSFSLIVRWLSGTPGEWRKTRGAAWEAIPAVPAVSAILVAGVATQHASAALIAAGGAMSIAG